MAVRDITNAIHQNTRPPVSMIVNQSLPVWLVCQLHKDFGARLLLHIYSTNLDLHGLEASEKAGHIMLVCDNNRLDVDMFMRILVVGCEYGS